MNYCQQDVASLDSDELTFHQMSSNISDEVAEAVPPNAYYMTTYSDIDC